MSYWNEHGAVHEMIRLKWFTPKKKRPEYNSDTFTGAVKELGLG